MSKRMYHPCHKLSVPSAKIFWCRHCMQMFEDAITRWKHSKICHASPRYKQKDQDARVVQLYVKADKVSYTSNIAPGQTVYHKPHVKKTSADLKCVICGTKFFSLYDMRSHVKEPCQRSDNTVACTQFEQTDSEGDTENYSSLKIRRVDSVETEESSTNTALSVLAEASKHVESLSHGEVIIEQVVEDVQQVIEQINQSSGINFAAVSSDLPRLIQAQTVEILQQQEQTKEVVVAYPRPPVRPELGTVVIALQSEDGKQILPDSLDLETIQDCVKDTALTLSIGQIIQIQLDCSEKCLHFVVGYQGVIWPFENNWWTPASTVEEKAQNSFLSRQFTPALPVAQPVNPEPQTSQQTSTLEQILSGKLENNIKFVTPSGADGLELLTQPIIDSNTIYSQEIVVTSEEAIPQQEVRFQYSDQSHTSLLLPTGSSGQQVGQATGITFVDSVCIPPTQNLAENLFTVSLIHNTKQLVAGTQTSRRFGEEFGVQAASEQPIAGGEIRPTALPSKSEVLIEALLNSSVVVSQPGFQHSQSEGVAGRQLIDNFITPELAGPVLQSIRQTVNNNPGL